VIRGIPGQRGRGQGEDSGATLLPHELLANVLAPLNFEYRQAIASICASRAHRKARGASHRCTMGRDDRAASQRGHAGQLPRSLQRLGLDGRHLLALRAGDATHPAGLGALDDARAARQAALREHLRDVLVGPRARHDPEGAGLAANAMVGSQWGGNTDLHAVFVGLLLPLAVEHRVPREDMVKRLFVFLDMQFDQTTGTWEDVEGWETNHDAIARAYAEAGYDVPEIVYWNLTSRLETVTVEAERKGVALMSGFSPAMMKVSMGEDADAEEETMDDDMVMVDEQGEETKPTPQKQEMTPLSIMRKALGMASYDKLVVLD